MYRNVMQCDVLQWTKQKLRKMVSSSNLRYGSVWIDKLFEMINQEFKAEGTKYQVLPNYVIRCRELEGLKVFVQLHGCSVSALSMQCNIMYQQ